jgi:small nuclear ribonucleoprotein (snRNP)-like protein
MLFTDSVGGPTKLKNSILIVGVLNNYSEQGNWVLDGCAWDSSLHFLVYRKFTHDSGNEGKPFPVFNQ